MNDHDLEHLGVFEAPGLCSDWDTVSFRAQEGVQVYDGPEGSKLLLHEGGEDGVIVIWCLLRCLGTGHDGPVYVVYMHGSGIYGMLREPRHTYFGEDGYISFVQPKLLAWAFNKLSRWFDY